MRRNPPAHTHTDRHIDTHREKLLWLLTRGGAVEAATWDCTVNPGSFQRGAISNWPGTLRTPRQALPWADVKQGRDPLFALRRKDTV